ncbi:MAG: flagellin [Phycisphaeraceae bacterium]|nr:flagellin [Phycisphaerales bacterium]MCB9861459.1 flagellin [Phycisphaeraceae bacterium]
MSRINTNVQSLIAQRVLGHNNFTLNKSLERLSTGFRINRGKDDPAGLIASENLRSDIRSINQAVSNAERADQVMNIAEGGLQEISSLLTELQGLLTAAGNKAGLSKSEKEANQLQVDSILQTIDRIAGATSFQGTKLLNGNFDYSASSIHAGVKEYKINGAKFEGSALEVDVIVTASAQQAGLFLSNAATSLDLGAGSSFVFEVGGALGSREFTFASSVTLSDVVSAINSFTDVTGVKATVSGTGIRLDSEQYGSDEFVSLKIVDDGGIGTASNIGIYSLTANNTALAATGSHTDFDATDAKNGIRDNGQNIGASVNGILATANGRTLRVNTDFLDVEMTLSAASAQTLGALGSRAFAITGGGADFQLASDVNIAGKVSIGIQDVAIRNLGREDLGYLDDLASGKQFNLVAGNNLSDAQKVVDAAIDRISRLRGRLGAFQKNTLGSTIRSLQITSENTQAAESAIRDTDFAKETAELTRSQILVSSATNILSLANQSPQSALQLLG